MASLDSTQILGNLVVTGKIANADLEALQTKMDNFESDIGQLGGGTITSVVAGNGLTGGSTSGGATLHVGAGTGISVSADAVGLATSGVTAGSYGPSANASPAHGGTISIPYVTFDSYGRATSASTKTITLPSDKNTDTKATQTVTTSSNTSKRPLLMGDSYSDAAAPSFTTTTGGVYASHNIYIAPSEGHIFANQFNAGNTISAVCYYENGSKLTDLYATKSERNSAATTVQVDVAVSTNETYWIPFQAATVGTAVTQKMVRSNKLKFNPSSGKLTVTSVDGSIVTNSTQGGNSSTALYLIGVEGTGAQTSKPKSNNYCYIKANKLYVQGGAVKGSDYAEFFEWKDQNIGNEDRIGLFVTLDEYSPSCIRLANAEDDDILGIVSAAPGILGNCAEDEWVGKYRRDVYGRVLTEEVEIVQTVINDEGEEEEVITKEKQPILSDEFDATIEYTPRGARKEWAPIGLMGQLVVQDDGTCIPGRYCINGDNGIATFSAKRGWRVMERIDDTHIRVYFK